MPAHGLYGQTRGVRWDPETQSFVMKCDDCQRRGGGAYYWPLTLEFWTTKTMQRCKACHLAKKARLERERLKNDADHREQRRIAHKVYYSENRDVARLKKAVLREERLMREAS